jgi:hypothetical protein
MQQVVLGHFTSQEISCIHYYVHMTPKLTTVLSRMNPIHTFPPYFLTHCGRVMQICVFNTRLVSMHYTLNYAKIVSEFVINF